MSHSCTNLMHDSLLNSASAMQVRRNKAREQRHEEGSDSSKADVPELVVSFFCPLLLWLWSSGSESDLLLRFHGLWLFRLSAKTAASYTNTKFPQGTITAICS